MVEAIKKIHRADSFFLPFLAVVVLVLLTLQGASGAWTAEFDGHPDEAAHFVTGRMVQTYLTQLPRQNPVAWAKQYYLRYPKVAMGHWPPGYHLTEALWWMVFGASRFSSMMLQCVLAVASIILLYRLVRPRFPAPVVAGIVALTVATPVFQQNLERTMVDLACLLCSLCLMHAVLRRSWGLIAISLLAAAAMKGNAVCLLPLPLLALNRRPDWRILAGLAVAGGGIWVLLGSSIRYWAGISTAIAWPWDIPAEMTGWGVVAIAAAGLTRDPLSRLCALMVASALAVSYAVRAMNEPRHWIIILPALMILGAFSVTRFPKLAGAGLAFVALLLFPWTWCQQTPSGTQALLKQLPRPARMMVSSSRRASGEGSWIAETNMTEGYPGSFVARASRVLATSGWNSERYQLLVNNRAEVQRRLDELAIGIVVADGGMDDGERHHRLLVKTVEVGPGWRQCGRSGNWVAWCRTLPPTVARVPLVLETGGWQLVEEF